MINRTLIRLKVVQLMYAYYQNSGRTIDVVEKELLFSMAKSYDLYNLMLLLMVDVTKYARKVIEHQEELNQITHNDEVVSHRFVDNAFVSQLEVNKQLCDYKEAKSLSWNDNEEYLKSLYQTIVQSEEYKLYMAEPQTDYAQDRELWRRLYKQIIMRDEKIDEVIEDLSVYWNDDKEIVDTFVLKTIKRFSPENGADQELVPEFKDEEDREFAMRLLRRTIVNDEYYRSLINSSLRNWELNRLAYMDLVIMQIAIAEILSFPEIPITVTINEYLEIAKCYSTSKSFKYINGVLDTISRGLISEGKLMKKI